MIDIKKHRGTMSSRVGNSNLSNNINSGISSD